jgi:hypothetical protein
MDKALSREDTEKWKITIKKENEGPQNYVWQLENSLKVGIL